MKTFSWSRYDSLRLDPEPGTSIWDYEVEEAPEPDAEPDEGQRCANADCTHRVYGEDTYCHVCLDLQHIGQEEYKRARARGWED
jgi:hypothetical protein